MILPLLLAASAYAADAPAAKPAPAAPLVSAEAAVKELESCVDDLEYFNADLKKKGDELDKEFKGKVPSAFVFLMNMKRGRVTRQHDACAAMVARGDSPFAAAEAERKALPGDGADYKKKTKDIDALRGRLNKAIKRFLTASR